MRWKSGKIFKGSVAVLVTFLFFLLVVLSALCFWVLNKWDGIYLSEIAANLTVRNLRYTEKTLILKGALTAFLPLFAVAALFFIVRKWTKDHKKIFYLVILAADILLSALVFRIVWKDMDGRNYFLKSEFVKEHYIDPDYVKVTAPENKRNLIYIFMESMETGFADRETGGLSEENYIPELTRLALENECFNGEDSKLNGAVTMKGTDWTLAGIISQRLGFPLVADKETKKPIHHGYKSMGEILQEAGYKNYFLQGSSAGFTGKGEVFREHGDYEIYDYDYAINRKWIPEDYKVWWGFEDRKLFEFARERLTEIGSREEAFNFSMLTVDTHPQDGYVCELCEDKYDTQYANVAACASSQVYDFVQWCKAQDFYKNTTIVISGDHVSMNGGTFDEERKNRRVYTCYINPAVKPEKDEERHYTVFDDFPTTLAALGFEIEGERLGLGTNLFSDRETLCEEVGQSEMTYELSKRQIGFENK